MLRGRPICARLQVLRNSSAQFLGFRPALPTVGRDKRCVQASTSVKRGEPRCTFVDEIMGSPLLVNVFPKLYEFQGDAVLELVEPGLYQKAWRAATHRS